MIRLVAAELLKLATTRMVYGLLGALLLIVLIVNVAAVATAPASQLADGEEQAGLFGAAASGIIFVLLLGVMLMAGEFRHGTITQTLLITPNRWKVLGAKIVAGAVLGLAFGAVAEFFSLLVTVPLLQLKGVELLLGGEAADFVFGTVLTTMLAAVLGVTVGTLIRNQIVAVIGVFVTFLIVEPIVAGVVESRWAEIPKYFPGHALAAALDPGDPTIFSRPGGAAVLLGYVLVFGAVGGRFVLSRDVNSIQA